MRTIAERHAIQHFKLKQEIAMADLFDVVEVEIGTGRVTSFMGEGKTERNADAIERMAVMRRGVETHFYATVPAGKFSVGDEYRSEA